MSPNKSPSNHRGKLWIKGLVMLTALLLVATGCGKKSGSPPVKASADTVVATYKGGQVTDKEFEAFLGADKFFNYSQMYAYYETDPSFKDSMLKQYVGMQYLTKDASDDEREKADKAVAAQLEQFKQSMTDQDSKDQYQQALESLNIQESDLKAYIKSQYIMSDLLKQKFTDDQLKTQYDEDIKADSAAYIKATVDQILIGLNDPSTNAAVRTKEEALKRAQDVEKQLKDGGSFADLAKQYSDDPGSKDNGGQYKDALVTDWVPEFKNAALTLPLNQISDPVETEYGYHVMKVESRTDNKFDTVKEDVRTKVIQQYLSDFMANDLPGIILTTNLPTPAPTAAPSAAPDTSAAPDASGTTAPDAPASSEASPSPSAAPLGSNGS